jgi:CheY-like chemotaxis protein
MENAAFASGAAMAVSPVQAYPGGTMRVLAVEEDPACLTALTQMLQRHGYQGTHAPLCIFHPSLICAVLFPSDMICMYVCVCAVTAKASPEEGLRALQDNPEGFDLVMTVVRTQEPWVDGFVLLRHAAQLYPVIRKSCVICISIHGFRLASLFVRVLIDRSACVRPCVCVYAVFSGVESAETKMRGMLGGACAFLTKPLRDEQVRDVWQHVIAWRRLTSEVKAVAHAPSRDVVREDGTARKRGLNDSGEGGSDGRTAKKNKLNSSSETDQLHAAFVKAAEQLRGTKGN